MVIDRIHPKRNKNIVLLCKKHNIPIKKNGKYVNIGQTKYGSRRQI